MELRQFSQGQFAETFEGSAADFLKNAATATTQPPNTTSGQQTPAATAPVTDPLKAETTLDQDRDEATAAALIEQQQQTKPEGDDKGEGGGESGKEAKDKKGGRPPVKKLDDGTKALVENLIKENKLFGFQDGKIETERDLQELLDANFEHREKARMQEIQQQVMGSMSPAFQFVAQYANQLEDPTELLPLLQSTSNVQRFASLDENNPAHQEMIVRERMRLNGDSDDIIEQEITDLKDRAKLAEKAKVYKPVIAQFYERQTQQLIAQKQQEEQEYVQLVEQNNQNIRKVLDANEFDGLKLNKNHKGAVYELLAVPREEYGGGMGIYHIIDQLFQQGQFNRLAKIALLAADEKAFEEVFSTKLKFANADSTIRALNVSGRGGSPTQIDIDPGDSDPNQVRLPRPSRSGFGFQVR